MRARRARARALRPRQRARRRAGHGRPTNDGGERHRHQPCRPRLQRGRQRQAGGERRHERARGGLTARRVHAAPRGARDRCLTPRPDRRSCGTPRARCARRRCVPPARGRCRRAPSSCSSVAELRCTIAGVAAPAAVVGSALAAPLRGTLTISPSARRRARLSWLRSALRRAPPARLIASRARLPAGSTNTPACRTAPTTYTVTGPRPSSRGVETATVGIDCGVLADAPASLEHTAHQHQCGDAGHDGEQDESAVGRHPRSIAPRDVAGPCVRAREACRS